MATFDVFLLMAVLGLVIVWLLLIYGAMLSRQRSRRYDDSASDERE